MPENLDVYVGAPQPAPQVMMVMPQAAPQVNVNSPPMLVTEGSNDRTVGAAINFMTVLIILAVVVFLAVAGWSVISGTLQGLFNGPINVNVR